MTDKESTQPPIPFLLRYSVELLTLAAIAFILQTGFVPFDFSREGVSVSLSSFFSAATTQANFPDIVANIFLYVPLGALVHWTVKRRPRLRGSAFPLALVTAAILSGVIEWCQAYSPSRVSSVADLVCNISGAGIGAALSGVAQAIVPRMVGATLFELRMNPRATVLKLYCLMIVVFAALPFSFSLDFSQLKKSAKSAVLVPFGETIETGNAAGDTTDRTSIYALSMARWEVLKRWSRWSAETVSFAVLMMLLIPLLRDDYGFTRRDALGLAWWLSGLFAVSLSVLQFPIVSRGLDTTDILFRLIGVGLGLATHSWYTQRRANGYDVSQILRHRRLAGIACALTVAYIVYTGVLPLVFEYGDDRIGKALASPAFLPFRGYFETRFDVMFTDVIEKCAAYAVFAALLATAWTRLANLTLGRRVCLVLPVAFVICFMVESVQIFLPVRIASLTDPILAGFGCVVGLGAQMYATDCWRFARDNKRHEPQERRTESAKRRSQSVTDELVGSLIDPREDAPRENSPSQRPTPQS
jgi:VanZ family protein